MVPGIYFTPANVLSKQKCVVCRGMRKPRELKVTCYTARMVDINENLSALPGAKEGEKIFDMEINEILLNIISNG